MALPALVLAGLAGCQSAPPAQSPDEARQSVTEAELAFANTMANRDITAFARFIADDAVFHSGKRALRGRDAVVKGWTPYFTSPQAPFSWSARPDRDRRARATCAHFRSGRQQLGHAGRTLHLDLAASARRSLAGRVRRGQRRVSAVRTGGCHCGAVRFEVDGMAIGSTICRCTSCRRVSGALRVPWTTFVPSSLRWTRGQMRERESSARRAARLLRRLRHAADLATRRHAR